MPKRYSSHLLFNDYASKISCFEMDNIQSKVFVGTSEGVLVIYSIDFAKMILSEDQRVPFPSAINHIGLVKPNLLIVVTSASDQNMFAFNTQSYSIETQFKTNKDKIISIAFNDSNFFFTLTQEDKIMLYEIGKSSPSKSFKIPKQNLSDFCLASNKTMFIGTSNGDILVLKVNCESLSLSIENSMKIDQPVVSLEVFYKNEKLLMLSARGRTESLVYIIDASNMKVLNMVKQKTTLNEFYSYLTFTLIKNSDIKSSSEITLVGIGDNEVCFSDIEDKSLDKKMEFIDGESFHLRNDLNSKGKIVKFFGEYEKGKILSKIPMQMHVLQSSFCLQQAKLDGASYSFLRAQKLISSNQQQTKNLKLQSLVVLLTI